MSGRIAAALVIALAATAAAADGLRLASTPERVALLELYTSEGCSSCPPADRWVSELKDDPRLWRDIVPVALHVDYWDYIGWKDRFAVPEWAERQRLHRRRGHIGSVYTPGFVVGGEEWRAWFRNRRLALPEPATVGSLELLVDETRFDASYDPVAEVPKRLELHVAVLGFDLATRVAAGENHGRTLRHDFVVLGHTRTAMSRRDGRFEATGALPEPLVDAPRLGVAAWVSAPGDPFPIQATGGYLGGAP